MIRRNRLQDFIQEKLDGKIKDSAIFDFKSLNGSDQFGCPGRRFDSDDTEIMRAVYVLLWGDELPELTTSTLSMVAIDVLREKWGDAIIAQLRPVRFCNAAAGRFAILFPSISRTLPQEQKCRTS